MNYKIRRFNQFLSDIREESPVIEAIQKAFNVIFESTEDAVETLKNRVPKPEKPAIPELEPKSAPLTSTPETSTSTPETSSPENPAIEELSEEEGDAIDLFGNEETATK